MLRLRTWAFEDSDDTARALNDLARHELKLRILQDLRAYISICQMEGWDYREYLFDLIELIKGFVKKPETLKQIDEKPLHGPEISE